MTTTVTQIKNTGTINKQSTVGTPYLEVDVTPPSGYTVSFDADSYDEVAIASVSFTWASAELATTYSYSISSSGGGTPITGTGEITAADQQITGIDCSTLSEGTLTLTAYLTDNQGNQGADATDTATYAAYTSILDDYPGAYAAFSTARRMSGSYESNLIRVRETGGSTEANIGYNGSNNLDTTALLAHTGANDGFIRYAYDQSGNARDFGQSVSANQPKIVTAGTTITVNSKPAADFDMDWLTFTQLSNAAVSVICVVKADTPGVVTGSFAGQVGSLSNWHQISPTLHSIRANGVEVTFASSSNSNLQLFEFYKSASDAIVYKNGSSLGTTSTWGAGNFVVGSIGAIFSGARYLDGKILELIIYNTDQRSNGAGIRANINSYYGIY